MMKQIRILTVALATATLSICSAGAQTDSTKTVAPPQDTIPHVDFQVVHDRMAKLEKEIPLTHNDVTHQFVEFFAVRKPSFVKTMLERKALYFPIFEKYLAQYGLPDELKYLSLIESRLEPTIISYAGAGGLWQFMPSTARIDFKLRVDKYVDERFDPYKATEAACKYFLQLGRIFNYDWEMMLASYTPDPAMRSAPCAVPGGKKGYWNVYPYLHKQTRGYVPQYAAIVYMMHYADDHGIRPDSVQRQAAFDTIHVNSYLNLKTLAAAGQIPYDKLRQLNPHILTDVLPNDTRQFPLRLPKNDLKYFYAHRQSVIDSAIRLPYDDKAMLAAAETRDDGDFGDEEEEPVRTTSKKFLHRVRRGESLVSIAHKYDIDGRNLKIWNRLGRRAKIHPGQKLVVYKLVEVPASSALVAKVSNSPRSERLSKARKYHTVQRGDTLWKISQRYGGISIDKIKKINGIKGNEVRPGQKLLII